MGENAAGAKGWLRRTEQKILWGDGRLSLGQGSAVL